VDDAARRVRWYRYVEERMMRILGGWIALTPELDAKLLFGRHVWDCAQHADLWGRRLPELRAPAQLSEPASEAVARLLDRVDAAETRERTLERVTAIYRVLKPHLATVYERHLAVTNPVYEPPTRRILQRCLEEERRHAAAGAIVLDRLVGGDRERVARVEAWERTLLDALAAAGGVTGEVAAPLIGPGPPLDPAVVAQDLVPPPPAFDPAAVVGDLGPALDAHGRALGRGDRAAVAGDLAADATPESAAAYAALAGPFERVEVVGAARIGRYRVVKLRLEGARARAIVQERWVPTEAGWRVAAAEVIG
jgi:hypothetical protein